MNETPPESPYELLEKLLSPSPHVHRFHARVRETGKEVELRVGRSQDEEEWLRAFTLELRDLATLDHPAFLPVLSRGVFGGRGHYAVPLRLDPHLGQLGEGDELSTEARVGVLTSLLGGVVHAHGEQVSLTPVEPTMVALSRSQGVPYFLHHRASPDAYEGRIPDRLPDDCHPGVAPGPRADLFHWGRLAFWFLTRGEWPYPRVAGKARRRTLRSLVEGLPAELAEVVDACLEWSPEARPESSREAHEVVVEVGVSRAVSPGALPDPEGSGAVLLDSTELDMGAARERVAEIARAMPGKALDLGTSLTLDVKAIDEAEAKVEEPALAPAATGDGSGMALRIMLGAFLVLGAFAAGLALDASAPAPPAASPRRVVREPSDRPLPPRREIQEVDEDAGARYREDPRVRRFLGGRETTPETFRRRWQSLLRLAMRRRVPGVEPELARIEQLKDVYREDPRAACEELDFYRRSISRAVGFERPGAEGGQG